MSITVTNLEKTAQAEIYQLSLRDSSSQAQDVSFKLESIGYDVIITKPHATDVVNSFFSKFRRTNPNLVKGKFEHKVGYAGFIFATKNN